MAVNQPGWHMRFTYRGGNSGAELRLKRAPGSGRRMVEREKSRNEDDGFPSIMEATSYCFTIRRQH